MFVFATYGNFQAETNMWRRLTRFEGADLARSMSQMLALAVRFLPSCSEGRTEIHTQTVRSTLNVKTSMSRCATEVGAIPEYAVMSTTVATGPDCDRRSKWVGPVIEATSISRRPPALHPPTADSKCRGPGLLHARQAYEAAASSL